MRLVCWFSLVSVKDMLKIWDSSRQVEVLPDFPQYFSPKVTTYLMVVLCKTIVNLTEGYPLEWFKCVDILLLGDIHLQRHEKSLGHR